MSRIFISRYNQILIRWPTFFNTTHHHHQTHPSTSICHKKPVAMFFRSPNSYQPTSCQISRIINDRQHIFFCTPHKFYIYILCSVFFYCISYSNRSIQPKWAGQPFQQSIKSEPWTRAASTSPQTMSLFRHPNKQMQRRVYGADYDEETEENNGHTSKSKSRHESIDTDASPPPSNKEKRSYKKHPRDSDKSQEPSLLSFGDEGMSNVIHNSFCKRLPILPSFPRTK